MAETRTRRFQPCQRQLLVARRLRRACVGARDAASQRETPAAARHPNYRE